MGQIGAHVVVILGGSLSQLVADFRVAGIDDLAGPDADSDQSLLERLILLEQANASCREEAGTEPQRGVPAQ
jgi:hypothetical protein